MRTYRHLRSWVLLAPVVVSLVVSNRDDAYAAPPRIIPDIATSKDVGSGPAAAPGSGLLAKAARCAAIPETGPLPEDCLEVTRLGVFAASSDGASYLYFGPAEQSSCAGDGNVTLERTTLVKGKLSAPETVFKHPGCDMAEAEDSDTCSTAQRRAIWKALSKLARDGFRDLPDLAGARREVEAGIQMATPVAVLGAPFQGWMLYLQDERSRSKILLVDPSNTKAIAIGHRTCSETEPYPDAPDEERLRDCFGSIEHVALSADRKGLILSTSYHDGGHCSPHMLETTRYWLPKEARALLDAAVPGEPGVTTLPR